MLQSEKKKTNVCKDEFKSGASFCSLEKARNLHEFSF